MIAVESDAIDFSGARASATVAFVVVHSNFRRPQVHCSSSQPLFERLRTNTLTDVVRHAMMPLSKVDPVALLAVLSSDTKVELDVGEFRGVVEPTRTSAGVQGRTFCALTFVES